MPPSTERRLPPPQVNCKWWMRGYCSRGKSCYFKHDESTFAALKTQAQDEPNVGAPATPSLTAEQAVFPPPSAISQTCAICYELPDQYGLLVNCDHAFCLECIRNWRATAPKNPTLENELKKTSKTCPMCRSHSDFIIPSSIWPTSTQKKEISDGYLRRLKTIPCRYFEQSAMDTAPDYKFKCQFRNHCHYSHIHPVTKEPYTFPPGELQPRRRHRRGRLLDEMAIMEMLFSDLAVYDEWVDVEEGDDVVEFMGLGEVDDFGYDYAWE
ncbi:uncharacterized protein LY89DRAFT_736168 [Mollisia scopiformis]|uniref:Uncharacterized protein n=1 Tax=Mollisia scopiformis TaxID=149040 RepID=A0A194X4K5_MOLSC|nr:uncharacterized protein LY89DRAFT_736168 [Mollisia scopiformis]KUJ15113.1 hypothetical protein LY89DRAFT_736168 [Mollisia scopiformis]